MLLAIHLVMTGSFVLLGVVFASGKGTGLIAGYNTATRRGESKLRQKMKLCKAMSRLMFALAGCWLVIASSEVFKEIALLWIGLALFLVISVFGAVYVNRGCKVRPCTKFETQDSGHGPADLAARRIWTPMRLLRQAFGEGISRSCAICSARRNSTFTRTKPPANRRFHRSDGEPH